MGIVKGSRESCLKFFGKPKPDPDGKLRLRSSFLSFSVFNLPVTWSVFNGSALGLFLGLGRGSVFSDMASPAIICRTAQPAIRACALGHSHKMTYAKNSAAGGASGPTSGTDRVTIPWVATDAHRSSQFFRTGGAGIYGWVSRVHLQCVARQACDLSTLLQSGPEQNCALLAERSVRRTTLKQQAQFGGARLAGGQPPKIDH